MAVFISYITHDRPFAEQLSRDLSRAGVEIITADTLLQPGDTWPVKIMSAIEIATVVLIVVSHRSGESEAMRTEISFAVASQQSGSAKRIIPVMAERSRELPFFLRHLQYLDLATEDTYRQNLPLLLQVITAAPPEPPLDETGFARRRAVEIGFEELAAEMEEELQLKEHWLDRQLEFFGRVLTLLAGVFMGVVIRVLATDSSNPWAWVALGLCVAGSLYFLSLRVVRKYLHVVDPLVMFLAKKFEK